MNTDYLNFFFRFSFFPSLVFHSFPHADPIYLWDLLLSTDYILSLQYQDLSLCWYFSFLSYLNDWYIPSLLLICPSIDSLFLVTLGKIAPVSPFIFYSHILIMCFIVLITIYIICSLISLCFYFGTPEYNVSSIGHVGAPVACRLRHNRHMIANIHSSIHVLM